METLQPTDCNVSTVGGMDPPDWNTMSTITKAENLKVGDVFAMPAGSLGVANELRKVIGIDRKHYSASYAEVQHVSLEGAMRGTSLFLDHIEVEVFQLVTVAPSDDYERSASLGGPVDAALDDCEVGGYIRVYKASADDAGNVLAVWL